MKLFAAFLFIILAACNNSDTTVSKKEADTSLSSKPITTEPVINDRVDKPGFDTTVSKEYSNARFRKVTVQRIGENTFRLRGQGQIFEANFSWVIEDGHEELAQGYQMTDAGAPEWGKFDFTVKAIKKRPNSTLHIILFESSAKDGSRVHELPVRLY